MQSIFSELNGTRFLFFSPRTKFCGLAITECVQPCFLHLWKLGENTLLASIIRKIQILRYKNESTQIEIRLQVFIFYATQYFTLLPQGDIGPTCVNILLPKTAKSKSLIRTILDSNTRRVNLQFYDIPFRLFTNRIKVPRQDSIVGEIQICL